MYFFPVKYLNDMIFNPQVESQLSIAVFLHTLYEGKALKSAVVVMVVVVEVVGAN